jgi:tRNA uridine 5-carboxymethylaminomethyl modification enzyme
MSCNPAIGGLGKGHLVREIDALDGLMAKAIDLSGIQFRMLNRSRGPAVHGPRSQADRNLYKTSIKELLNSQNNLSIIEGTIKDLIIENNQINGVILDDNTLYKSKSVVLTTGTFLGGVIHIGDQRIAAGRMGDKSSDNLSKKIRQLELPIGRLKTGTPPRIKNK